MEYKDIKKLMDDMGNSTLDSLDIEFPDGLKISMKKNSNVIEASTHTVPVVTKEEKTSLMNIPSTTAGATTNDAVTNSSVTEENYKIVKSPMVGTFYSSSAPGKPPYVSVGDKVKKGQVLCVIEAMKLMNEIESEFDGEIAEICVKNEDVIEYGQPLFKIK